MATVTASGEQVIALNGIALNGNTDVTFNDVIIAVKADVFDVMESLYNSFLDTLGNGKDLDNLEKTLDHYQRVESFWNRGFHYRVADGTAHGTVVTCENAGDLGLAWEPFDALCADMKKSSGDMGKAIKKCNTYYADVLSAEPNTGDCSHFAYLRDAEFFQTNTGRSSQIFVNTFSYDGTTDVTTQEEDEAFATGATKQENKDAGNEGYYHMRRTMNNLYNAFDATICEVGCAKDLANLGTTLARYQQLENFKNKGLHYKRFDDAIVTCDTYRRFGRHPWEYFDYLCETVRRKLSKATTKCYNFYKDNTEGHSNDCINTPTTTL